MKITNLFSFTKHVRFVVFFSAVIISCSTIMSHGQPTFDIVLMGGRVIDPETGLDGIRNIGIRGGRIAEISETRLAGSEVMDVTGLVVAPGFIDLHVHGITNREQEYQAHDGVTTAFELEVGIEFLKTWHVTRASKALINYGGSASWRMARMLSLPKYTDQRPKFEHVIMREGWSTQTISSLVDYKDIAHANLQQKEIDLMLKNLSLDLDEGAIGIGLPLGYDPLASREEIFRVFQFASKMKAPIFIHVRDFSTLFIQQAIADAAVAGASLHIVHVNSMALGEIDLAIEMVSSAQRNGLDITTELYPYTAASTFLQSALFEEGWQDKWGGISYRDIQWVATGERLTESTFNKYRKEGGIVVIHMMKPEWIARGIKSPVTMIASDGMPYAPLAHPRTAGTFSRVLGKFVREEKLLSLPDAIKKMTLMPANRLESIAPMMRLKGRVQVGCDADITVFDPAVIIDKATFEKGLEFSDGIRHVLINGVLIVKDGKTVQDTFPGKPVFGKYKK